MDGSAIRQARKARGLTQQQLAQAAGIAQSYVSMIESGAWGNVTTDTLERIALALGMTVRITLVDTVPYSSQPTENAALTAA